MDRREKASHGYRAVHIIVSGFGHLVEVQVRTEMQHLWAELSEKMSDVLDPALKYGGGSNTFRRLLDTSSDFIKTYEEIEAEIAEISTSDAPISTELDRIRADMISMREDVRLRLRDLTEKLKREHQ
jgi:ppGpp synthetase/RelA/SpoT-type nucleotidyltranferase